MELLLDVLRMSAELSLGVGIKLFCDNGRISFADFRNDFLFWLPGMAEREDADGLTRQAHVLYERHAPSAIAAEAEFEAEVEHVALAAK